MPIRPKRTSTKQTPRQPNAPPMRPHPGMASNQMNSQTGHIMNPGEQAEKWKKTGYCPTCGRVKTHNIFLRGTIRTPILVCCCCLVCMIFYVYICFHVRLDIGNYFICWVICIWYCCIALRGSIYLQSMLLFSMIIIFVMQTLKIGVRYDWTYPLHDLVPYNLNLEKQFFYAWPFFVCVIHIICCCTSHFQGMFCSDPPSILWYTLLFGIMRHPS